MLVETKKVSAEISDSTKIIFCYYKLQNSTSGNFSIKLLRITILLKLRVIYYCFYSTFLSLLKSLLILFLISGGNFIIQNLKDSYLLLYLLSSYLRILTFTFLVTIINFFLLLTSLYWSLKAIGSLFPKYFLFPPQGASQFFLLCVSRNIFWCVFM